MTESNEKSTFDLSYLRFLECCDCGLVHTISYEAKDETVLLSFVRNEPRTQKARAQKASNKGKTMCQLLDEARLRENLVPISNY